MKYFGWVLGWVLAGGMACVSLLASPEADTHYAFKILLATVVNLEPDNVHAQYVQTEIEKYFQTRPRFEVSQAANEAFRQSLPKAPFPNLSEAKEQQLTPFLAGIRPTGADSALLVQLQRVGEEYQLVFVAAALDPVEIIYTRTVPVADRFALTSFGSATSEGLTGFVQGLPFDATIINREGYRVIIDRGLPSFKTGTRVAAYTLERGPQGITLSEAGVVAINRADKNLSFGTVLVENKPLEVLKGNKVRFQTLGPTMGVGRLASGGASTGSPTRNIASTPDATTADYVFQKEHWGLVDIQLVGNIVSWNRTSAGTGAFRSDTAFYPGAAIRAEVRLSRHSFAELGGMFSLSTLSTTATGAATNLNSQTNQVRAQLGYRLPLGSSGVGPSAYVKGGYSRCQYQVDELPNYLAPSSVVFSGLSLGGGFEFPFSNNLGFGLDMTALALPSISEGGGTSGGAPNNISGWDFSVRAFYHLNDKVNIEARMVFQTNTVGFTGQGTRPVALASLSQTNRAFLTGISYYF